MMVDFRLLDTNMPAAFGGTVPDILGAMGRGDDIRHQMAMNPLLVAQKEQEIEASEAKRQQAKALALGRLGTMLKGKTDAQRLEVMNDPAVRSALSAVMRPEEIDAIAISQSENADINQAAEQYERWIAASGLVNTGSKQPHGSPVITKDKDGNFFQSQQMIDDFGNITVERTPIQDTPITAGNVGDVQRTREKEEIRTEEAEKRTRTKRGIEEETASGIAEAGAKGKAKQARRDEDIEVGKGAVAGIPTLIRSLELLDFINTGGLAAANLRAKQFLGIEGADEAELSNLLSESVLARLRSTFGAQFTEREGARLESIAAGVGKSTPGNRRILENTLEIAREAAKQGIQAAIDSEDYRTAAMLKDAMELRLGGERQTAEEAQEGEVYENPETGERITLQNGEWVPFNG